MEQANNHQEVQVTASKEVLQALELSQEVVAQINGDENQAVVGLTKRSTTTTTTATNSINEKLATLSERDQKWAHNPAGAAGGMGPQLAPIYHFKILVPAAAAGRIIGKGGTTIAQLQKDAGASVKMSKASEFYPGTTERVCLISGPMEGILKINDFFMENFSSTSIKILVPNSTAGMIIGKGGSYIKQIKEESGAYVQISQKCTDFSLPERCVTVVGELENIRKACIMILNKIVEDVGSAFRDIRASSMTASMMFSHQHNHHNNNNNNNNNQNNNNNHSHTSSCSSASSPHQSPNHHHSHNNNSNHLHHFHSNNHNHHHHSLSSSQPSAAATAAAAAAAFSLNGNISNSISPASSIFGSTTGAGAGLTTNHLVKTLTSDHLGSNNIGSAGGGGGGLPISTNGHLHSISPPLRISPPVCSPALSSLAVNQTIGTNSTITSPATSTSSSGAGSVASAASSASSVWSDMNSAQIIETIKLVLRVSGYGEDAVSEISSAMSTLANYGVLGVGLGLL